jgi:hypothetical protein
MSPQATLNDIAPDPEEQSDEAGVEPAIVDANPGVEAGKPASNVPRPEDLREPQEPSGSALRPRCGGRQGRTWTCPTCGAASETCYRCSACGKDLVAAEGR